MYKFQEIFDLVCVFEAGHVCKIILKALGVQSLCCVKEVCISGGYTVVTCKCNGSMASWFTKMYSWVWEGTL